MSTDVFIPTRIAQLEAQKAAAAESDAPCADTAWAAAEGEILELRARLAKMEREQAA